MKKLGGFLHYLTHQSRIIDDNLRSNYEHLPIDLNEVFKKSLSTHKISVDSKGLNLTMDLKTQGIQLYGHMRDLLAVIEALLSNALRYVPTKGDIRIRGFNRQNMFQ